MPNTKKKAIVSIIAICLFALFVCGLTACGASPNNEGNGGKIGEYIRVGVG